MFLYFTPGKCICKALKHSEARLCINKTLIKTKHRIVGFSNITSWGQGNGLSYQFKLLIFQAFLPHYPCPILPYLLRFSPFFKKSPATVPPQGWNSCPATIKELLISAISTSHMFPFCPEAKLEAEKTKRAHGIHDNPIKNHGTYT